MLSTASVTTMLPVKDLDRARAFYEGCLGFKPEGTKADHTAVSFRVEDIAASIKELKRAGVVFEDYGFPGLKTVNHVCVLGAEKAAWFKDIEGNYLCLHEDLPEA
jgi:catechol 2,3-dioxygenase-like lactoylglutathione lyase family enzyme